MLRRCPALSRSRFLAAILLLACCGKKADHPTNLILVSLDTLRADALGWFGYARDTSPNVDRFLNEAVVFSRAYAPEPHTLPSHVSLFTGLHPFSHGVQAKLTGGRALPSQIPTLASILAECGFETRAFVNGGYLNPRFGIDRGFERYDYFSDIEASRNGESIQHGRTAAETNVAVFRWLEEDRKEPFFLFVHYFDIHSDWGLLPYDAPEHYRRMFLEGEAAVAPWNEPAKGTKYLMAVNGGRLSMTQETLERVRSLYDSGVRYTDDRLGELLEGLKERGLYDDSIIVLVSDHGEEFLEHGMTQHEQLFEECLRIPLAFRLPGSERIPPGVRKDLVSNLDVLPTLLDYLGVDRPEGMQGRSLLPTIRSGTPRLYEPMMFCSSRSGEIAYLHDGWKLIYNATEDASKLFDLGEDPRELTDLAAREPARVKSALTELQQWRTNIPTPCVEGRQVTVDLDPGTIRQLQALGYVR